MSDSLRIHSAIAIPLDEIELTYVRSGGPGGQNVNKVASKAVLRFNVQSSPSIPSAARERILSRLENRITKAGDLVLSSSKHRDQIRNRETVLERLQQLLVDALRVRRRRVRTRPSAGARERRLVDKKVRAEVKQQRKKPASTE